MNVEDVMTTKVIACASDTPVSEILSLMERHKIHQIPVIGAGDKLHEKGDVLGIVTLNKIIISEVDPAKAKAKAFMQSCPRLAPGDNLKKAARILLDADMRAVPVWEGGLAGIVAEQDVMKGVQLEGAAVACAKKCLSAAPGEPVAKVKRLMALQNVSRVAVVSSGRVEGIVGTLDLIPLIRGWQRMPVRSASPTVAAKEKVGTSQTPARNFMHGAQIIDYNSPAAAAVKILRGGEEVLLQKDGEFHIITPKDILRAYAEEAPMQLVQIAGVDKEDDPYTVARMYESAGGLMQTLSKSLRVQAMKIYVKKHHKQGMKTKYSVKIELPTSLGMVVATKSHEELTGGKSFGDLLTIFQHSLNDAERQVRKLVEKKGGPGKRWGAKRVAKEGY